MQVSIKRLSPEVPMPEYKTQGACAFDLAVMEAATLPPGGRAILPTGLIVKVPEGHVLVLASRSSNAKKGIQLSNGIGVIDQDYHGPNDQIHIAIHNFSDQPYTIQKGDRVAQALIIPLVKPTFIEVDDLQVADRGGFGTTG